MGVRADSDQRWLWYACRTSVCVPLDRDAYPATVFGSWVVPWPDWACKAPDGGIHHNSSLASIDIQVSKAPSGKHEFNWTCDLVTFVLARSWYDSIEELVDPMRVGLGRVFLHGQQLRDWVTIHGRRSPPLLSTEGRCKVCPICGEASTVNRGQVYFADPAVRDMPLIVNDKGIFIREDEVIRRNLRTPVGAFKPSPVPLRVAAGN